MSVPIRLHEEDPALLREAIRFTSAETGFIPRLIEKDYFCSVLMEQGWCADPRPAHPIFGAGSG